MTYRLYLSTNTYALTVQALMEDMGLDHELVWVGIFQDTPDEGLLKVSPHSRVPALNADGTVLFETGAIALWLAEQHGDGDYLIPPGDPRRGIFLQWFHYLATTGHLQTGLLAGAAAVPPPCCRSPISCQP